MKKNKIYRECGECKNWKQYTGRLLFGECTAIAPLCLDNADEDQQANLARDFISASRNATLCRCFKLAKGK